MKTLYECEICHKRSESRAAIEACEARGVPDMSIAPPPGLLFGSRCGPDDEKCAADCKSHLCMRGYIFMVQMTEAWDHDPHQYRVVAGMFRRSGLDTYSFNDPRNGYDDFARFGWSKYSPEAGFVEMSSWPEAQDCPALIRAAKAVRDAGLVPLRFVNGELVEVPRDLRLTGRVASGPG